MSSSIIVIAGQLLSADHIKEDEEGARRDTLARKETCSQI